MMNSHALSLSPAGRTYFFANNVLWALLSLIDNILPQLEDDDILARYQTWIRPSFHLANFLADERFFPEDMEQIPQEESSLLDTLYIEVADTIVSTWGYYFDDIPDILERSFPQVHKSIWVEAAACLGLVRLLKAYDLMMHETNLCKTIYHQRYLTNLTKFKSLKDSLIEANLGAPWNNTQDAAMTNAKQLLQSRADHLAGKWTQVIEVLVRDLKVDPSS